MHAAHPSNGVPVPAAGDLRCLLRGVVAVHRRRAACHLNVVRVCARRPCVSLARTLCAVAARNIARDPAPA